MDSQWILFPQSGKPPFIYSFSCLFGLLAILEFSLRGPVRELEKDVRSFNDFCLALTSKPVLGISGRDPYASAVLNELWPTPNRPHFVVTESLDGTLPAKRGIPSPYLTTAFPLLLPFAVLPWKIASPGCGL